ncbi:MAG TPA: aspartyl protease family protein [Chthoniobacteraceae bacterium]|nr:aspartyl protease family protein [Chthoniobacteraceae bacterium]
MRAKLALLAVFFCQALASASHAQPPSSVPFQFRSGLVWIEISATGSARPLHFLVDSGASQSVIDLGAARRCGLRLGGAEVVQGVDCETEARHVRDFRAEVAGSPLPASLLAIDLSTASRAAEQHIDGLIGADFFRGRIVQIDFAARRLRLLESRPSPAAGGFTLPIRNINQAICLPIAVNGGRAQWVRLDTGCDEALQWVTAASPSNVSTRTVSIGLSDSSLSYTTTKVKIGEQLFNGVRTGVHRREIFPGESGLLGNGLLSRFRLTIDGLGHEVVFERL